MARPLSPGRWLLRVFENSPAPLAALDANRNVVFANRSLGEWLGVTAQLLIGRRCDYTTGGEDPIALAAAALCPSPEALDGQRESGLVTSPASGDRRLVRYLRLPAAEQGASLLLMLIL